MSASAELRSGKGSGDENFPVASLLIERRYRPPILAFYEFVRVADDIADHPTLGRAEKLMRLNRLEASLLGEGKDEPEGVRLREILRERSLTPRHAQDLLDAFRQDVTKLRYTDWADLIDYCSRSAMPVGRFVLDVHGEPVGLRPANDALCAALQIINHLQDCAKDYRALDRVYIPLDAMVAHGVTVEALGEKQASPALRACIVSLTDGVAELLRQSAPFAANVRNTRLSIEISVIQALAERLIAILRSRDPLSEQVHLSKPAMLAITAGTAASALLRRLTRGMSADHRYQPS